MSFTLIKPSTCFVPKTSSSSNPQRLRVFTLRCSSQVASSGITQPTSCIYQCIPFFFSFPFFFSPIIWNFIIITFIFFGFISNFWCVLCFCLCIFRQTHILLSFNSVQFPRFDSLYFVTFSWVFCDVIISFIVLFSGLAERPWKVSDARLVLEDGSVWKAKSFGASGTQLGEVVFNTSLTG